MTKNGKFQVDLIPSFCNAWPEIEIEINGVKLWKNSVDHTQTVILEFDLKPVNQVYIRYLNKRNGPDIYDTEVDDNGNIIADQMCELDNFIIQRSRCDFLKHELEYYRDDNTVQTQPWGFLAYRGHYCFEFPETVHDWIIKNRKKYMLGAKKYSSSLAYWTNYLGDPTDPLTQELLTEIDILLGKINDKDSNN